MGSGTGLRPSPWSSGSGDDDDDDMMMIMIIIIIVGKEEDWSLSAKANGMLIPRDPTGRCMYSTLFGRC